MSHGYRGSQLWATVEAVLRMARECLGRERGWGDALAAIDAALEAEA